MPIIPSLLGRSISTLGNRWRSCTQVSSFRRGIASRKETAEGTHELEVSYLDGKHSGVVVLGLNRPQARNSLGKSLVSLMFNAIDAVRYDKGIRVVILRSLLPKVFCSGADLKERANMSQSEANAFVNSLRYMTNSIESLPCPVIAAIDGVAVGGGLEIALACDLRTASSTAKMGLVETKLAIIPGAGGSQRLPRIVGLAKSKELIYTAKILDGEEALSVGLVNRCVPQNEDGDAAFYEALSLASEILPNGPIGVQMAKAAINRGTEVDIASGCFIEEACYGRVLPTSDRLEGLKAFKEKRAPVYKGE